MSGLNGQFNARLQKLERVIESGGSSLPSYSSSDIGKVLTVGEAEPVAVVPEQTVSLTDGVGQLANFDFSALSVGDVVSITIDYAGSSTVPANVVDDNGHLKIVEDSGYGNAYITDAGIVDLGMTGFSDSVGITVTFTPSTSIAEPKWEATGLPDYSNAAEGAVLKIVSGVPTWTTT